MTLGRTADLKMAVGKTDQLFVPVNILGGGVNGVTNITTEPFIGETYEQASVHSAGSSPTFGTIYDTAAFDAAVAALIPTDLTTASDGFYWVCWAEVTPRSWQAIPVDFAKPGSAAPAADAITRTWALSGRGRGMYGTTVIPFSIDHDGGTVELLNSSDDRDDFGDRLVIVTTRVASGASAYHVDDGTSVRNLEEDVGIQILGISSTDQALTIDCSTADIDGVALIGTWEVKPSG